MFIFVSLMLLVPMFYQSFWTEQNHAYKRDVEYVSAFFGERKELVDSYVHQLQLHYKSNHKEILVFEIQDFYQKRFSKQNDFRPEE